MDGAAATPGGVFGAALKKMPKSNAGFPTFDSQSGVNHRFMIRKNCLRIVIVAQFFVLQSSKVILFKTGGCLTPDMIREVSLVMEAGRYRASNFR